MWGWSHTPFLGGVIEGNILEDAEKGGSIGVQHDGRLIKTNQGRVYMTVKLNDNVVRWSDAFLSHARGDRFEADLRRRSRWATRRRTTPVSSS